MDSARNEYGLESVGYRKIPERGSATGLKVQAEGDSTAGHNTSLECSPGENFALLSII